MEIEDLDFDCTSTQGFPFCPFDGSTLFWQNDFMLSDFGYAVKEEDDSIVQVLECGNCETTFYVILTDVPHLGWYEKPMDGDWDTHYTKWFSEKYL